MKVKIWHRNLITVATVLITVFLLCCPVFADSVVDKANGESTVLELYSGNADGSAVCNVQNMFPGDSVNTSYKIKVSHKNDINVYFDIDLHTGSEKLAEVLKCQVSVGGETVYDGLMKDISEFNHELTSEENTAVYEISIYLDNSVGNEYMNKNLTADFIWWVEDEGNLVPKTGDSSNIILWCIIAFCAAVVLSFLLVKRKKGNEING